MPKINNDRWWYGPKDGRESADFGGDARPSADIGSTDHDARPRHHAVSLEDNGGGVPRFQDNRRTHLAIPRPVTGVGLVVSGDNVLYGYTMRVLSTSDVGAVLAFSSNGNLIEPLGTVVANAQFRSAFHTGISVQNLTLSAFDTATGLPLPAESSPSVLLIGSVYVGAME